MMDRTSLASLPDDIVLDIVEHLDTARDVAHVSALTKHLQSLIRQDGWRTFVKTRFPSLQIDTNSETRWSSIANRAAYLDRCWEKRGFWVNVLYEKKNQPERFQRRVAGSQSVLFHSVLDARLMSSLKNEVIAAGVGENLMVRIKPVDGQQDTWHQVGGHDYGYRAGTGDVTAVSVIENYGIPNIVVGRANGDISIHSGEDEFATVARHLNPADEALLNHASDPMRKSPGQVAVSSLQWHPETNLLASGKGSVLTLYNLSMSDDRVLSPMDYHEFSSSSPADEASLLRSTKFISKDIMACALGGTRNPLRWGQLTPTGLQFFNSPSNSRHISEHLHHKTQYTVIAFNPTKQPYHHTTALPCSPQWPFPSQKDDHIMKQGWAPEHQPQKCDSQNGVLCYWHGASRRNYWRPDATIHIGSPTYDRIYCLTKASDLSDTIYCGVRGAILEMNLHLTEDTVNNHNQRTTPTDWSMGRPGGKISLIETGVSLTQTKEWSLDNRGVPDLVVQQPRPRRRIELSDEEKRHRLDYAFHRP
ncbi:uncharacterized protein BKA55DRAFT_660680 [Fusarium redolens]|uniref:F-box domain-containing protein n=1 Tax=Fusarium redolens TaxID=48865 RepID=A0A9P9HX95_FUSRE|nr:uncharacterized protein BKA55DRAFT_660680 [Fusarium redolens]KAH7265157.1 hypothetical protein BKA55DRAFT_660680 [Fusarium redolens]